MNYSNDYDDYTSNGESYETPDITNDNELQDSDNIISTRDNTDDFPLTNSINSQESVDLGLQIKSVTDPTETSITNNNVIEPIESNENGFQSQLRRIMNPHDNISSDSEYGYNETLADIKFQTEHLVNDNSATSSQSQTNNGSQLSFGCTGCATKCLHTCSGACFTSCSGSCDGSNAGR